MSQRDLLTRLADRGEEMLNKFAETPGASRVLELMNSMRERLDDTQKRLVGLEALERRLDALERRLDRVDPEGAEPAAAEELLLPGTPPPPAGAEDIVIPPGTSVPPAAAESPRPTDEATSDAEAAPPFGAADDPA